jgi:hypothetical protein
MIDACLLANLLPRSKVEQIELIFYYVASKASKMECGDGPAPRRDDIKKVTTQQEVHLYSSCSDEGRKMFRWERLI